MHLYFPKCKVIFSEDINPLGCSKEKVMKWYLMKEVYHLQDKLECHSWPFVDGYYAASLF